MSLAWTGEGLTRPYVGRHRHDHARPMDRVRHLLWLVTRTPVTPRHAR